MMESAFQSKGYKVNKKAAVAATTTKNIQPDDTRAQLVKDNNGALNHSDEENNDESGVKRNAIKRSARVVSSSNGVPVILTGASIPVLTITNHNSNNNNNVIVANGSNSIGKTSVNGTGYKVNGQNNPFSAAPSVGKLASTTTMTTTTTNGAPPYVKETSGEIPYNKVVSNGIATSGADLVLANGATTTNGFAHVKGDSINNKVAHPRGSSHQQQQQQHVVGVVLNNADIDALDEGVKKLEVSGDKSPAKHHHQHQYQHPQQQQHHHNQQQQQQQQQINSDLESCQRRAVLSYEQVCRLSDVMNEVVSIHGRGNFPTLEVRLRDLVSVVKAKLEADPSCGGAGMKVRDIKLNGGAASHVLATESQPYNDLDLIFAVELMNSRNYDKVKAAVLCSLFDLLPEGVSRKRITTCSLKEAYVSKMVKVNSDGDRWSLISLGNSRGHRNVELKFVDSMRRQFEFSVDSFQIVLDSLLYFHECHTDEEIGENLYPTVVGESVYGDFHEALYHLQKKLISTRHPEEIRGGGLLKYCNLLVKMYKPAQPDYIKTLERYMCSRFFIDFPDIGQQRAKLENYLWNHFVGPEEEVLKYQYLMLLHSVVEESTVCLMGHERRQTLALIESLAYQVFCQEQQRLTSHHTAQPQAYVYANGYYYAPVIPTACYTCTCNSWMACSS